MLTKRQVEVILLSWRLLTPESQERFIALFYERLFKINPTLEKGMFAHVQMDEQKRKLGAAIATVVDSVENLSAAAPTLKELGKKHAAWEVTAEQYSQVGSAVLYALGEVLNDDFTSEVEKAWTDAYEIISTTMQEAAAELV